MVQSDSDKEQKPETIENEDIEELRKALEEEKCKCEANLAGWQRAQADYLNLKRVAEQEKTDICKFANANLILNILPVIDDFERALAAIPSEESDNQWIEGFKLIDRKFRDILEKQGVVPILTLGMEFDPRFMEAVTCGKGQRDIVIQELEKGYKLQDKVIRPARVVVGTGEE